MVSSLFCWVKATASYDEATEEYTGNVEILSGEIANLTKTASKPGGISLFTDDTKQTFKSTTQILREISQIWDELDDKTQASLLEKLAGKRNGNVVSAILSNFGAVEKSLDTMSNSAGNAEAEMSVIMESLDYKLNALKETATGFFQNLFEQEEMGRIIDFLTSLLNFITEITSHLGLLGTTVAGLGIYAAIKRIS